MIGSRQAVFLDRDGVLNEPIVRDGIPHPPASTYDLVLAAGVEEACERLRSAGLLLIVVTNQPDLARGSTSRDIVDRINHQLRSRLRLDDVFVCPHDDRDCCACRKPKPGLLLEAASRWGVNLGASVMIGDRWRDVEAGRRAGCATVLVRRNYAEESSGEADHVADSLHQAVPWILHSTGSTTAGGEH
ncbi:MAG: HAD family hydrolase [Acidimicrobiaceae bacterium]|nr:HAD family hydrolase [Acidimicrobiaceae bacterium]